MYDTSSTNIAEMKVPTGPNTSPSLRRIVALACTTLAGGSEEVTFTMSDITLLFGLNVTFCSPFRLPSPSNEVSVSRHLNGMLTVPWMFAVVQPK